MNIKRISKIKWYKVLAFSLTDLKFIALFS